MQLDLIQIRHTGKKYYLMCYCFAKLCRIDWKTNMMDPCTETELRGQVFSPLLESGSTSSCLVLLILYLGTMELNIPVPMTR